jgi:hypothetical protein
MGGRYGGDINMKQRRPQAWKVSLSVLQAIGANARPDLEAIGRKTRRLAKATAKQAKRREPHEVA